MMLMLAMTCEFICYGMSYQQLKLRRQNAQIPSSPLPYGESHTTALRLSTALFHLFIATPLVALGHFERARRFHQPV